MQTYYTVFSIAGISIRLRSDHPLEMTKAFREFAVSDPPESSGMYHADFRQVSRLNIPKEPCVYEEGRILVYQTEDGRYHRGFREYLKNSEIYAISHYDLANKKIEVEYLASGKENFRDVQSTFGHIAWEVLLLHEKKLLLHASYVDTPFGGIAFSGPSGIGKSTQGNLWCQYGAGRLINGDKLILSKEQNWMGYGSPYAGSSSCYVNDSCRLKGLFFLRQGEKCSLRLMGVTESFKKIYSGLTLNRWDGDYVEGACDLAQQLAIDVPAYEFTCTPDKEAVDFLQQRLHQGGVSDGT